MSTTRALAFCYGTACYLAGLAAFGLLITFVAGIGPLPRTVDSGPAGPAWLAVLVDGGLIALFGLQHSAMARRGFKRRWTRLIPAVVERSTYVLATCVVLTLLFALWRPLPPALWDVTTGWMRVLAWCLCALGWATVFVSAELLDARRLLGLRQVWRHLRDAPLEPLPFMTPGPYRWVRHPMMLGFLVAFWVTPTMTLGHLLFSLGMTGYIAVGMLLEERDLVRAFGERYRAYRRRVAMVLPGLGAVTGSRHGARPPEAAAARHHHGSRA